MNDNTVEEFARTVEDAIDENGVAYVLETLAAECRERAEHLRHEWQDSNAAAAWDKAAKRVDTAAESSAVYDVDWPWRD